MRNNRASPCRRGHWATVAPKGLIGVTVRVRLALWRRRLAGVARASRRRGSLPLSLPLPLTLVRVRS
ncbi:MAG TPA: hypothetical protein VLT32_23070, partial [Candidatus Sulfomarinibacteraceae bacterium]|nr:hypothetical protein [Candidatus Sulfomarinibacteraceae bacterium]